MTGLVLPGLLLGCLWSVIFRAWSGRARVERLRHHIEGDFLEIAVYRNVPRQSWACALRIAAQSLQLGLSLLPVLLIFTAAVALTLGWWGGRYRYRPVWVGETVLVQRPPGTPLNLPPGLRLEAEVAARGRLFARIRVGEWGRYDIGVPLVAHRRPQALAPTGEIQVLYPPALYPYWGYLWPWWCIPLAAGLVGWLLTEILQRAHGALHLSGLRARGG